MRIHRLLCLLAALAVTCGIAAADGGAPAAEPASVPLFTNEDLEKYGPSDAPDRPVADTVASGNQDWTFVNKFIEGQYEKIKSEREYSLELSEREGRRDEPEWDGWTAGCFLRPVHRCGGSTGTRLRSRLPTTSTGSGPRAPGRVAR